MKTFCFESSQLVKEPRILFLAYSFCFDTAWSWRHEITSIMGVGAKCVQGVFGTGPAHPPQVSCQISEQTFIFIFLAQSKHMQRGGKQPPASFYNRVQQYKNLILSPFMLPIKLQMLLLSGVPLMHVIEWVICQPPALWYYWAKCCLFPMLKHFSMSFQLLLCMIFSRARASIDSKRCRIINISS